MRHDLQTINIVQGECVVSADPRQMLSTVLGSCVSACIFDLKAQVGGMNHFLLPHGTDRGSDNRFAAAAMERLVNALLKQGATRAHLRAKLFGGARMMTELPDIGTANAEAARRFLSNEGIACTAADLGGRAARRVRFVPTTGEAFVFSVNRGDAIVVEKPVQIRSGEIELF